MAETIVIGVLLILVVFQQVYWSKIVFDLTNRLMSRNYTELVQAENLKKKDKTLDPSLSEFDDSVDPDLERQARELNSIFGMV